MSVAVDNGGYVTPALVTPVGVPAVELRKMVARGVLESAGRGIYRVPSLPLDPLDEFIVARMWAGGRGVVSHDSALVVHQLSDINPTNVHLTIPTGYRISRAGGEPYVLHRGELDRAEITHVGAVVVTTIRRTLGDIVGSVPTYLARQAIQTAREHGSITRGTGDRLLSELNESETA